MTFCSDKVPELLAMFEERKNSIRNFPGCTHLELLRDIDNPDTFFTYSHWEAPAALEQYRVSDFFKDTWKFTKARFAMPAEAWSVETAVRVG